MSPQTAVFHLFTISRLPLKISVRRVVNVVIMWY